MPRSGSDPGKFDGSGVEVFDLEWQEAAGHKRVEDRKDLSLW